MENTFKIYLDSIVFSIQQFGGASTYWKELLLCFTKKENVSLIVQEKDLEILNADAQEVFSAMDHSLVQVVKETAFPSGILRYLPLTKRLPAGALYHNSYYRTCLQKSVINIFTVHDFTHKRGLASKFPRNLVHIGLTALGLKNADGIICISESTKRDLLHYYPDTKVDNVKVIYHGVSTVFKPLQGVVSPGLSTRFDVTSKYVLFVGKREGYKKFDIVPPAVKEIAGLQLVIVGGGVLTPTEKQDLEENLPGRYHKLDGVSNVELNELYNNAYCLVYPSIYEGFGIPLVEAMRAGCPVITNKLSSLSEVAGDAALFIEEISSASIVKQLVKLEDTAQRQELIEKGYARGGHFSWEKCCQETFNFYKEIYSKKFNSQ